MRRLAHAAAGVLVAGSLVALSACGGPNPPAEPGAETTPSVDPIPASGDRDVRVLEVLSGATVVVTPSEESDQLFGKDFTVRVLSVTAPEKGECGFEKSKTFAEEWFSPANGEPDAGGVFSLGYPDESSSVPPINEEGEHRGHMSNSGGSYTVSIREGYTVPNDENGEAVSYQGGADDAKKGKKGVYAECPDFGEE